ncbi:PstS family phosphate ABC transporter substrate-binding protein [Haloferula sp.]|uniref:PstS family phosphate ABC transporter substrate-binding protein n=1 Tax=Haloferula sp. TaxID=2497595 RepID=UPI003C70B93A
MNRLVLSILAASAAVATAAESHIDETLPSYKTVSGVSGSLSSVGSDTLNNLMTLWAEGFKKAYPNVTISIEGKGSSTAPPALMEGTAQFGPMSRPMKAEEIDAFEKKFGYKPTQVRVAIDALAVFAHKDNPLKGLTLKQVDGIFSSTRKLGGEDITEWGQLGMDAWKGRPISLYGRNSASGTYGFFQENVLGKGDYKATVKEQPGSSAVVQGIGGDLYALGYSGIGYKTSGVRTLPLSSDGGEFFDATYDNALSGDYPLARFLIVYVNKKPGAALPAAPLQFLTYVLSKEGQTIVEQDGYFPMPAELAQEIVDSLSK